MIELRGIGFRYAGTERDALADIDCRIEDGETLLLTGASGCGKTTFTRLLNGLIPEFHAGEPRGEALLDGRDLRGLRVHEIAERVGSVFQDPRSQFFTTNTTSELAFGCENRNMAREAMLERIRETARVLSLERLLDRDIFGLSGGERQMIAVGSVHACGPDIYVFDEPSANLDEAAAERLRGILAALKAQGRTLVISEHRLHYLRDLIDRALVLAGGRIVREITGAEFRALDNGAANALGLRAPDLAALEISASGGPEPAGSGEPALELDDVSFAWPDGKAVLDGVGFRVGRGEIVGLTGLNGAGKSTLAGLVCGLLAEQAGATRIGGRALAPKERIRKTYFVLQDADYQLFAESVERELLMGGPEDAAARQKAEEVMAFLDIADLRDRHPASLSGGQKQRVSIAAACMRDAEILFFDEPTSGLDLAHMRRVAELLREAARQGRAVIVITHDAELVRACADAAVRLEGGRVA